jgi:hypothetical protein
MVRWCYGKGGSVVQLYGLLVPSRLAFVLVRESISLQVAWDNCIEIGRSECRS